MNKLIVYSSCKVTLLSNKSNSSQYSSNSPVCTSALSAPIASSIKVSANLAAADLEYSSQVTSAICFPLDFINP
ncbi:hypothetical protein HanHA89_Chr05g0204371 [Helianthus annuus]|nr:hypothetical protein HanHA89_Chr05g0204371 [Helianthus annuus]